jgi:hypothetical protein
VDHTIIAYLPLRRNYGAGIGRIWRGRVGVDERSALDDHGGIADIIVLRLGGAVQ